ncbi:MAG: [FeFe] hydrogenase, group A [Bacteroidales bacterium]|jgi:NADP-reducing hydrogenase subunit HndD|nr:[FeFe] hydrogenase, group A [Bacteroidales bacterium]MCI2121391.1 [FeFe] hydrogenase, group A [Bacteroidales bacterium]MCI2145490.1 [FeFe] hydrogenase, group A [Bacteroidales bacterium]
MDLIKLTIDNVPVEVEPGTTILKAAEKVGIKIPTLCYMELPDVGVINNPGACRMCVVDIGGPRLFPACATTCTPNMVVKTNSPRVLNARRTVMQLILSDHPADCLLCAKNDDCELRKLAAEMGVHELPFVENCKQSHYKKSTSPSINRDQDKCIMCRRCETMCNEVESVGAIGAINRGFNAVVATAFERPLVDSNCVFCGQCVAVCPTGALTEVNNNPEVLEAIADPTKTVIVETAPSIRAALGEEFGLEPGTLVTGKMVAALRRIGFDYVFDTDFAADMTIMEEGSELVDRLTRVAKGDKSVKLPLFTSCCPAWVNFCENEYPEMLDNLSTAKSPMEMFGPVAKSMYADKLGIKRENLVVVSVMPCVAKKFERQRPEFSKDGDSDVNIVITTRELARLIKINNIDFKSLPDEDFDAPMGESTGGAVIFGNTGGVMEAAVRVAYELVTGKKPEKVEFDEVRGFEGVRMATIDFAGTPVNVAVAHELRNARKLVEMVKSGKYNLAACEVMACPGGCIGGAGQPFHHGDSNILIARHNAIYREDENKKCRRSNENKQLAEVYKEFLGKPLAGRAHELLHTRYFDRHRI